MPETWNLAHNTHTCVVSEIIPKCVLSAGVWEGVTSPPHTHINTHTHTNTLFWNLSVFWQNVLLNLPGPVLSVNLEYFRIKTQCRILSISSTSEIELLPTMTAFNEVIYDLYDTYDVCNVMSLNEQKRWHENQAIIPT